MSLKLCHGCDKYKKWSQFNKNITASTGYNTRCKECHSAYHKKYRNNQTEEQKYQKYLMNKAYRSTEKYKKNDWAKHLKRKFGISASDYEAMMCRQESKCAICHIHQSKVKRKLCVDHCHATKKVRGLLCNSCNTGLGNLKDNKLFLRNAIIYLERS